VDPVPDPLLLRKSGSAGDRTRDLCICSQKLWPLDHRGGLVFDNSKFNYENHVVCTVYILHFNYLCFKVFVFIAVQKLPVIARYFMYRNICSKSNFAQIGIGYTYGHPYMYAVHKTVQLKSKLHHAVAWSAATRSSRSLCYRPAIFFRHFRLAALSFIQGKTLGSFQ